MPRSEAARLRQDQLAEAIEVAELPCPYRGRVERRQQPERGELGDRVGRVLIPTPNSRTFRAASNTMHEMPHSWSERASVSPPIPPPAMSTRMAHR